MKGGMRISTLCGTVSFRFLREKKHNINKYSKQSAKVLNM